MKFCIVDSSKRSGVLRSKFQKNRKDWMNSSLFTLIHRRNADPEGWSKHQREIQSMIRSEKQQSGWTSSIASTTANRKLRCARGSSAQGVVRFHWTHLVIQKNHLQRETGHIESFPVPTYKELLKLTLTWWKNFFMPRSTKINILMATTIYCNEVEQLLSWSSWYRVPHLQGFPQESTQSSDLICLIYVLIWILP